MQKPRILLVDDDEISLLIHSKMLAECGEIVTATNANEALVLIQQLDTITVVISDYYMPEISGVEFLQSVCQLSPNSVRIMITGFTEFEVAVKAVNKGNVFRFLVKPCKKEELVAAVRAAVDVYQSNTCTNALKNGKLVEPLTEREIEVLKLLCSGLSNREIAIHMGVAVGTVKTHINSIFGKLAVNSRTKAAMLAVEMGIV